MSEKWLNKQLLVLGDLDPDDIILLAADKSAAVGSRDRTLELGTLADFLGGPGAGDVTEGQLNTAIATRLPKLADQSSQSGNYTLTSADSGRIIRVTATATITLPNGLDAGFQCIIVNYGSGTVTLAATTTLNSVGNELETQYTAATVLHVGSNVWLALGPLT